VIDEGMGFLRGFFIDYFLSDRLAGCDKDFF
jgi:hypothetical protein